MRTYSRKPPEYVKLENVSDLCRLCLEKPNESIPIYADDTSLYSSLALRIMVCVGLEVTKEEYLSNIICVQCHQEVERYYLFRKKCEKSHQKLKSHLQSTKAKDLEASHNTVFTINPNGSILMKDSSHSLLENDQPLIVTRILNDEPKASSSEVLEMFNNDAIRIENSFVLSDVPNQLTDNFQDEKNPEPDKQITIESDSFLGNLPKEELLTEERPQSPLVPEISDFLSTMLTELGIITQHGDGIVDFGPKTSKTLELETKDGNNIVFELVEEDEEMEDSGGCTAEETVTSKKKVEVVSLTKPRSRCVTCDQCGKVLASRGVLARHVRNVHDRARPHACADCGKRFAQKEVLARHKLLHQEKRPFQCLLCPKSFTQRSALETHSRAHQHEHERALTLHPCPQCNKLFLYASGLSRHVIQHSSIRFPCEECGRRFADKSSLRRHRRTRRDCAKQDTDRSIEQVKLESAPLIAK